jgi:hypothetical protein
MSVILGSQFTQRPLRWVDWKAARAALNGQTQFDDDGHTYTVWFYNGPDVYFTTIWKSVVPDGVAATYSQEQNDQDKTEFENSYKNTANQRADQSTINRTYTGPMSSAEVAIADRAETTVLTRSVAAGKKFFLTFFAASAFSPLPVIVRIKVGGATVAMLTVGQNAPGSLPVQVPVPITSGAATTVTATVEAQVPRGQVWVGFAGIEE